MKQEFLNFPRSAKLYLISQFLVAGTYTWPFWFGFANERISASQFGIFIAVTYIVGLIAEVPTGAFADSFGRKRSALLGALCGALVPLIVYGGSNFTAYIIAAIVGGLGSAFISGSLESLLYELPDMNRDIYRRVMVHDTFFFQSGLIVAAATGGFMYGVHHFLPFAMQAISFLLAAVVIGTMAADILEERQATSEVEKHRLVQYLKTNKEGFLHLFRMRSLWALIVFGSVLGILLWLSIEYMNEAAMIHYGIRPELRGLLIGGAKVLALLALNFVVFKKIKTDRHKLIYLCCVTFVVFGFYSVGAEILFLAGFIGFNLISSVRDNFIRPIIHDHVDNRWRATAISSYSFVSNLLQAMASLTVGVLLQNTSAVFVQRAFLLLFLVVAVPAFFRYLPRLKES